MKSKSFGLAIFVAVIQLGLNSSVQAQPMNQISYTSESIAFTNVNIINTKEYGSTLNGVLLVNKGKIEKLLGPKAKIPAGYEVVDLKNKWVLPGLIDGHVHLAQSGSAFTRPDIIGAQKIRKYSDDQNWLKKNRGRLLEDYLRIGITSIFDLGGPTSNFSDFSQYKASYKYPEIYATAELISTADVPALIDKGKTFISVKTPEEALSTVKMQVGLPIHTVKFVWTSESNKSPDDLFKLYSEAMTFAKKAGKKVAVHVEELEYAKMAIKAGADLLIHGVMKSLIDDEFIALAKENNVFYMPSLTAYQNYIDVFKKNVSFTGIERTLGEHSVIKSFEILDSQITDTDQMYQMMVKYVPYIDDPDADSKLSPQEIAVVGQLSNVFSQKIASNQQMNLKKAIDSGIKVAIGTDAGNPATLHGASMLSEVKIWMDAGIPIHSIISTMTLGNAIAYGIDTKVGSLDVGKDATFAVYDQNPISINFLEMLPVKLIYKGNMINFEHKGN